MAQDRKDLWDNQTKAEAELRRWIHEIINNPNRGDEYYFATAGYVLTRTKDNAFNTWEWSLQRQIVDLDIPFDNDFDNEADLFDWTNSSSMID